MLPQQLYLKLKKQKEINIHWKSLVMRGRFEDEKALLSMLVTEDNLKKMQVCSIEQSLELASPTLATVKKYGESVKLRAALILLIGEVVEFFNVGKSMNSAQLRMTSDMIFEEFYFLKVSDIKLCFKFGMRGRYGKLYDRLDGAVLIEWLTTYNDERLSIAQIKSSNSHSQNIRDFKPEYWKAEAIEMMRKMFSKIKKPEVHEHIGVDVEYVSIEQYCRAKGLDFKNYAKCLVNKWDEEYLVNKSKIKMTRELFVSYKSNIHLHELNKKQCQKK